MLKTLTVAAAVASSVNGADLTDSKMTSCKSNVVSINTFASHDQSAKYFIHKYSDGIDATVGSKDITTAGTNTDVWCLDDGTYVAYLGTGGVGDYSIKVCDQQVLNADNFAIFSVAGEDCNILQLAKPSEALGVERKMDVDVFSTPPTHPPTPMMYTPPDNGKPKPKPKPKPPKPSPATPEATQANTNTNTIFANNDLLSEADTLAEEDASSVEDTMMHNGMYLAGGLAGGFLAVGAVFAGVRRAFTASNTFEAIPTESSSGITYL